jgi:hypothetical protein
VITELCGLLLGFGLVLYLDLAVLPSLELILGLDLNRDLMVGLGLGLGLWVDSWNILALVLVMICLRPDVL